MVYPGAWADTSGYRGCSCIPKGVEADTITSFADENSNGAKYLCELLEMEDVNTRLDRIVVVLTTGEYHKELTEDEQRLCKLLIGNCKSNDILLATDPSLGSIGVR